ncbi:DNA cytosine methyltransferase [Bdellovibrionota bacterium FG-2]
MSKLRAISLFSGAMGLDLGMEKAGFEVGVCVDNYALAVKTIRANTKIPVIDRDINDVETDEMLEVAGYKRGEVDLVFGGPPCQAFSTAGARRSLKDVRGNVITSFLRVVDEVRPRAFLLENVRGLLSSKLNFVPKGFEKYALLANMKGSVVYFLFKEFEKMGYKVSFSLFDSANFGVPQRRERVLMFGILGDSPVALPVPTHAELSSPSREQWINLRQALQGLREEKMEYVNFSQKHLKYLGKLSEGQHWKHLPETDHMEAMGKSFGLQGGKTGFYRRLSWKKPSPALVTTPVMPATMLCHPEVLRPLSIQEYARIQQFPDDWAFQGGIRDVYKQIGNAVPVGLGYAAGKALARALANKQKSEIQPVPEGLSRYRGTDHLTFIRQLEEML